ncbi:unnamed protein product [Dracunculus medinensis]|uniref:T3SS_YcgR_N domain-containing protein n=1 Tax=Dracunculus medinensis TaxID=318479 RepID=A0A0N4U7M7_DRAME|nr:unnamed protein product [Dracunculus medinensis]
MEIADSGEGWMRIGIKSIEYSGKYFEAENPQKRLDAVFIGNTRVLNVRLENLRRSYNKLLVELSYLPVDRETLSQCMFKQHEVDFIPLTKVKFSLESAIPLALGK